MKERIYLSDNTINNLCEELKENKNIYCLPVILYKPLSCETLIQLGSNDLIITKKQEIDRLTKVKETMENEYGDLLKAFAKSETEHKKEIDRLNKIIDEIEKIVFDKTLHETDYEGIFKCKEGMPYCCKRYYLLTELRKKIRKLKKELKEESK